MVKPEKAGDGNPLVGRASGRVARGQVGLALREALLLHQLATSVLKIEDTSDRFPCVPDSPIAVDSNFHSTGSCHGKDDPHDASVCPLGALVLSGLYSQSRIHEVERSR